RFVVRWVEGGVFKRVGWRGGFGLLGGIIFSMTMAPVLASLLFPRGAKEWHNPVIGWLTAIYRRAVRFSIRMRYLTVGAAAAILAVTLWLAAGIGSEFLPHLDEGAPWVRGTLAPPTGPD